MFRRLDALLLAIVLSTVVTVLLLWADQPRTQATQQETSTPLPADGAARIWGQPGADYNMPNRIDARGLLFPGAVAFDRDATPAHVYVADSANRRVLGWASLEAVTHGAPADLVIGQPDMHTSLLNERDPHPRWLHEPVGIAVDGEGTLYVADRLGHRILAYPAPFLHGVLPARVWGATDPHDVQHNPELANPFLLPTNVATGPHGQVAVVDAGHERVLLYRNGLPSDASPDVILAAPTVYGPSAVAIDPHGRLAVADAGGHRVLLFDDPWSGRQQPDAVLGQDDLDQTQPGASPFRFNTPTRVAFSPDGALVVSDTGNHRVLIYSPAPRTGAQAVRLLGQRGRLHGNAPNPGGLAADTLHTPQGAAVGPGGVLAVADGGNNRVLLFDDPDSDRATHVLGQVDMTRAGENLTDGQGLFWPQGIAVDRRAQPNRLYVADTENNRVLAFRDAGGLTRDTPPDLALGQPDVYGYRPNNPALLDATDAPCGPATLFQPTGLAVDAHGNLYVADRENNRVLIFRDPFANDAVAAFVLGQQGRFDTREANLGGVLGGVSARGLHRPEAVALGPDGALYVSDTRNHRVLRIPRPLEGNDVADRVWGQADAFDTAHANLDAGHGLSLPFGLAVAADGTLYVADTNNHRVLRFHAGDRQATTVLGQGGRIDSREDNYGSIGPWSLSGPQGVTLLPSGALLVTDTANCRLLVFHHPSAKTPQADLVYGQEGDLWTNRTGMDRDGRMTLWFPAATDYDQHGNWYVADKQQSRVVVYAP